MQATDYRRMGGKKLRADWMMHLRVAVADVDAVALDMLRKPTERKMGPAKHRELYQGAAGKLTLLLANLRPDADEDGPDARLRAASTAERAAGHERRRAADVAEIAAADAPRRRRREAGPQTIASRVGETTSRGGRVSPRRFIGAPTILRFSRRMRAGRRPNPPAERFYHLRQSEAVSRHRGWAARLYAQVRAAPIFLP